VISGFKLFFSYFAGIYLLKYSGHVISGFKWCIQEVPGIELNLFLFKWCGHVASGFQLHVPFIFSYFLLFICLSKLNFNLVPVDIGHVVM